MNILQPFSSHKVKLDGYSVMLASGNIDSNVARQLSAYIKQDPPLCGYLHVLHHQLSPYIDHREIRTWFVDGDLVKIKDWLIDDCEGLVHYPFPPLKFWPNYNCYKTLLARDHSLPSFQRNESPWRENHGSNPAFGSPPKANSKDLSETFNNLDLNNSYTPQSSVSSNSLATMDSQDQPAEVLSSQPADQQSPQVEDSAEQLDVTADGTVDRFIRKRMAVPDQRDTMAVFVHAGAGYHSFQNEHVHLTMCAK